MGRIEYSIETKASPEKVWEILSLDRLPEWMNMMESVKYTSKIHTQKDKYQVGTIALGTPKGGPPDNCYFEITESLEQKKLTYRMWEKWLRRTLGGPITYILESVKIGTKLTMIVVLEMPWGILLKILEPIIIRMGRKEFDKSIENLKNILDK